MAVNLSPVGGVAAQFFNNNGVILTGGKIFTYTAGTTTPQATYTSNSGVTAHSNPIILDASGRVPSGEIWLTDGLSYKFVIKDANDVLIGTYDNVVGINSNFINYTGTQEIQTATANQTVFTLTTMQYQPGTNSLSVFVDGVNQYGPGAQYAYVETGPATVTFVTGLHVGASVKFTTATINSAAATDASQVSYIPPFTNSTATNVEDKLAQTVSVKDFGAVGDGVADDTAAFNAAIAWANAKGGNDRANIIGSTIYIPEGRYKITTALNPITVSAVTFVGASKSSAVLLLSVNGSVFTFGDATETNTVVGGGVRSVKLEYLAGPTGTAIVFKVDYAFGLDFEDLYLENIGTLASLGQTSSRIAGGMIFSNIQGSIANAGYSLIDIRYGAGLTMSDCGIFVRGVLAPVNPASMTTVLGTGVFKCDVGFWDTLQVTNCIFERFDFGVSVSSAASMVYQNFFFSNTIMDYFKRWCVYLESTGGVISTIQFDDTCWYVSWEEDAINILQVSGFNDGHRFGGNVAIAGKRGVYYQVTSAKSISFNDLKLTACNRLGSAQGAMVFQSGSKGFVVSGCEGNYDTTSVGLPWRADYGISIAADCDEYIVTGCKFEGAVGGYTSATNAAGSSKRRIYNNLNANYSGYVSSTIPASGVTYTNKTPFVEDWSFIGGTLTTGYDKNGQGFPGALSYLTFRLQPNDTFTVGYSSAPTTRLFIDP